MVDRTGGCETANLSEGFYETIPFTDRLVDLIVFKSRSAKSTAKVDRLIGLNIQGVREIGGLSQRDLSTLLGISPKQSAVEQP
jgi:DNA-binding transcriptional regulator YiaG